jgi:cysteinyl-tRNA synthetase
MELKLYDTLTKEKRLFTPLDPDNVRMYVCGPTVYDFAHIGNGRAAIVFDLLFRLLRHLYGESHVTYVRNITDVDDKINARAVRDFPDLPLNDAIRRVTEKTATQYHADVAALGCLLPTVEPRATDFVLPRPDGKADMVTLIKQLIARGHAYEAGGEVLFDTASMPDYGMLSGRKLDEQRPGARIAVDAHKKSPLDFVLWKQSSDDEPGWESPWGRGRPGWHIECSAMSEAYLGEVFDIHGGGLDLIFPHHENELAQSRCAHGTPVMANYWMHNGFLEVEGKKMSKSEGNFVTIRELLADWPGEVLRLNMLKTHYRSPIDWTAASLEESKKTLNSWYDIIGDETQSSGDVDESVGTFLSDDLNTAGAITRLHAIAAGRVGTSGLSQIEVKRKLKASAMMLGLLVKTNKQYLESGPKTVVVNRDVVNASIAARNAARARKDFKESDRIRDELAAMGVVIKDSKEGTTWEIAR